MCHQHRSRMYRKGGLVPVTIMTIDDTNAVIDRLLAVAQPPATPNLQRTFGEERGTYYVIRTDMNGPQIDKKRHEHPSRIKAEKEAQRLAIAYPGVEFAVVKKKTAYKVEVPAPYSAGDHIRAMVSRTTSEPDFMPEDHVRIIDKQSPANGKTGRIKSVRGDRYRIFLDGPTWINGGMFHDLPAQALEHAYQPQQGDICHYNNERSSLHNSVVVVTGWEGNRPVVMGVNKLNNAVSKKARIRNLTLIDVQSRAGAQDPFACRVAAV